MAARGRWQCLDFLFAGLVGCGLILLLGLASSRVHSFDIFWQLQSGRYILQTGSFIHTDLFTLASEAARFEHCWLHDILFYFVWTLGGYSAVSLFKGLILTCTAALLILTARLRKSSWLAILCCLPLFLLTSGGWLERPQLWTFLGFSVFIAFLERHRREESLHLFWLFAVAIAWANLHAGSILALALLAAYLVGEAGGLVGWGSQLSRKSYLWLWFLLAGLLGAAFLTPYPDQLMQTLLGSANLGASKNTVGEAVGPVTALFNMDWRATDFSHDSLFFYAMGLGAVVMLLGWRRLNLTDLCLLGGLSLMGLKLSRHTSFLFFALLAVLPAYLDAAAFPLLKVFRGRLRSFATVAVAVTAMVVLLFTARPIAAVSGWFDTGLREWHYPLKATEFVSEQQLPGNLYNTYDWGGYLAWKLFPEYKVFWDGRQNSSSMFRAGWQVMAGKQDWSQILDQYKVNTVITRCLTIDTGERYPLLDRLTASPEWALVFSGQASLVFVRTESVSPDWLQAHRLSNDLVAETIRNEAHLTLADNRWRYKAWWELARLDLNQRKYADAFTNLEQYLSRSPQPDPVAENYYRMLYPMMQKQKTIDGK